MTNDHDTLIQVAADVKSVIAGINKINGRVGRMEDVSSDIRVILENHETRIKAVERRPSAVKAIILVGSIMAVLMVTLKILG